MLYTGQPYCMGGYAWWTYSWGGQWRCGGHMPGVGSGDVVDICMGWAVEMW